MAQLVKTVNGLAIASVKTVNGLAIASVKTINGLDNTSGGTTPPTFDAASPPGILPVANAYIATFTAGALTNGAVLVYLANFDNTSAPISVVDADGGATYTQIINDTGGGFYLGAWVAPKGTRSGGSITVTATYASSANGFIAAQTFSGVNQTTPTRTFAANSGSGTTVSGSVTTVANDLVTDYVLDTDNLVAGAGQTQRFTDNGPIGGSTKVAVGTSTSISWTCDSGNWGVVMVPLIPAS